MFLSLIGHIHGGDGEEREYVEVQRESLKTSTSFSFCSEKAFISFIPSQISLSARQNKLLEASIFMLSAVNSDTD